MDLAGNETPGEVLRDARMVAGIPQQVVGDRVGVSRVYIAQIESGAKRPKFGRLTSILDALAFDLPEEAWPGFRNRLQVAYDKQRDDQEAVKRAARRTSLDLEDVLNLESTRLQLGGVFLTEGDVAAVRATLAERFRQRRKTNDSCG